jgi:ABC-type phosphate transport system substrate-binding protein/uncharacterized coiled-coil protein SlyX
MSYRSIGTNASETEITASLSVSPSTNNSNFAVLGFNLNSTDYATIKAAQSAPLQIPIAILKTALINSVPSSMAPYPINLTDCALAGIYAGTITTWTDPAITKTNPSLSIPIGTPIIVVGRTDTSTTAMSLTTYLSRTCPNVWTYGSMRQMSTWPAKNTITVTTTDDMLMKVSSTNFTIGFASEALLMEFNYDKGLGGTISECALQVAGSWTVSSGALESAVSQILSPGSYPAITADWSNTSFLSAPATQNGWALTVPIILVVPSNASYLGSTISGLLSAWISFLLSPAGQLIFSGTGQVPLMNSTLTDLMAQVNKNLVLSPNATMWSFELAGNSSATGGDNYVFSQYRNNYATYHIDEFDMRLTELEAKLSAANDMIANLQNMATAQANALATLSQNNTARIVALEAVASYAAQDRARLNSTILDVATAESRATHASQIAIGGVVLAAILAVVALILAAVYVARTKRLDQKYSKYLPLGVKARFGDSADGL